MIQLYLNSAWCWENCRLDKVYIKSAISDLCAYTWVNVKVEPLLFTAWLDERIPPLSPLINMVAYSVCQEEKTRNTSWVDEPRLNMQHLLFFFNAKKHLFHTSLPPESHVRAEGSTCSGLFLLRTCCKLHCFAAQAVEKHDDMSKVARHVPSMFLRMGGGPVCGTLMLRKAKHWWPALGNNEGMEMDRERKGSQCEMLCAEEEEEERGEEIRALLSFLPDTVICGRISNESFHDILM